MKTITSGNISADPNWSIINLSPIKYLIDASAGDINIGLPSIASLPVGNPQVSFAFTANSDNNAVISTAEDDFFSNGTTDTTLTLLKGFTGSVILSVNNGKWNVSQQSNGFTSPIKIVGKMRQTNTNAPILYIGSFTGDSSLITVTPSYSDVGVYKLTFPVGLFTGNIVTAQIMPTGPYSVFISQTAENELTIQTQTFEGVATDGLLLNSGFSIEINPTVTI